jgi:hypothetical protein
MDRMHASHFNQPAHVVMAYTRPIR